MSPGVSRRSRLRLAVRVGRAELEGDNLSCRQIALVFVRPVPWQGHEVMTKPGPGSPTNVSRIADCTDVRTGKLDL